MASELVVRQISKLANALSIPDSPDLFNTLKSTAFKGEMSNEQFSALLIVATQYGLNPWTKEIYAFPDRSNGIIPVVGVDGWSRIVNSHPLFDGVEFEQNDESCTCKIYRKDRSHPTAITEWMSECKKEAFTNKSGYEVKGPWQSHPKRMLRHKAFCQAARLAFGYVGVYDQDEAERILDAEELVHPQRQEKQIFDAIEPPIDQKKRISLLNNLKEIAANEGVSVLEEAWKKLDKTDRQLLANDLPDLKNKAIEADKLLLAREA